MPFLLHATYRVSAFTPLPSFPIPTPHNPKPPMPAQHVQIYTWMDCTLRELALLLTDALPSLLATSKDKSGGVAIGTRLVMRLVYPDLRSGVPPGGAGRRGGDDGRLDEGLRARYVAREMGSVVVSAPQKETGNGEADPNTLGYEMGGEDAEKTLEEARFVIGDFVDVAVFPPLSDGTVVSRGSAMGGGFGNRNGAAGVGRENGYSARGGRGGGGGGGFGRDRGDFGAPVPPGEWRRGERLPGEGGYRGRGRGRF